MSHFDQGKSGAGFTPQIGTLSGNPIAAVAGLASLKILKRPGAYEQIFATGRAVWEGLDRALKQAGIPALVCGLPPMFDALFTPRPSVTDYRGTIEVDKAMSRRFNALVRERGVFKSDNKIYISLAHDARDVAHTAAAFADAAQAAASLHG
jgi:glutamate-1-semialdehyde 2,1-aminomutase